MINLRFDDTGILLRKRSLRDVSLPSEIDLIANLISSGFRLYPPELRKRRSLISLSAVFKVLSSPLRKILFPRELAVTPSASSIILRFFSISLKNSGYSFSLSNSISRVFVQTPYSFLKVTNVARPSAFFSLREKISASFLFVNVPIRTL